MIAWILGIQILMYLSLIVLNGRVVWTAKKQMEQNLALATVLKELTEQHVHVVNELTRQGRATAAHRKTEK